VIEVQDTPGCIEDALASLRDARRAWADLPWWRRMWSHIVTWCHAWPRSRY